jgi:hypothetical protein
VLEVVAGVETAASQSEEARTQLTAWFLSEHPLHVQWTDCAAEYFVKFNVSFCRQFFETENKLCKI